MLNRIKFGFSVVSVVAIALISWVMISPLDGSPTLHASEPPANVSHEDVPTLAANPELMVANRDIVPILAENEGDDSERLLDYLRWKHNAAPAEQHEAAISDPMVSQPTTDQARLQAYLKWAHERGITPESAAPQPTTDETRLRSYLNWAHHRGE